MMALSSRVKLSSFLPNLKKPLTLKVGDKCNFISKRIKKKQHFQSSAMLAVFCDYTHSAASAHYHAHNGNANKIIIALAVISILVRDAENILDGYH